MQINSFSSSSSRLHQTKEYVYKNKYWIDSMHKIMTEGWKAVVNEEFVILLRKI